MVKSDLREYLRRVGLTGPYGKPLPGALLREGKVIRPVWDSCPLKEIIENGVAMMVVRPYI